MYHKRALSATVATSSVYVEQEIEKWKGRSERSRSDPLSVCIQSIVLYFSCMPKIARKQVSIFESSVIRFGAITLGVAGVFVLGAIFLGLSDKGAIDVNQKIVSTDQSASTNRVNPNLNGNTGEVNGGLRPLSADPNAQPAPEPVVTPEPVVESASTTASSTEVVTEEAVQEQSDAE